MKKILTTPIKAEDLQDIRVGDVIYLTGTLVTCRDVCHRRLIELKRPIPYDLNGKAIFHAGPIVRKNGDKWEMVSVGPTTSMRMESFEREFIEQTGVKLVVGKGGMGPLTEEGCQKFIAATENIVRALGLVKIRLRDHIILAENDYFSMRESNRLPFYDFETGAMLRPYGRE